MNAFVAAQASILDFESRLRIAILTANEPFLFHTAAGDAHFTGVMTWSLKGFVKALRTVDIKAVEFHDCRDDFASWAQHSLHDTILARQLKKVNVAKLKGEELRKAIVGVAEKRFNRLSKQVQAATQLF
jgi:hypothetical protein